MNGTSRVTGDSQARFCERLGVKIPGPTRRRSAMIVPTATQIKVWRCIRVWRGRVLHKAFEVGGRNKEGFPMSSWGKLRIGKDFGKLRLKLTRPFAFFAKFGL